MRKKVIYHALAILSLMWTGLANGQPFFFPDTTNYIRAADLAVYIASGKKIETAWTASYQLAAEERQQKPSSMQQNGDVVSENPGRATSNDLRGGSIMGGRSPYIGALLYAGYVLGAFWPFVLMQAVVAYLLITLTLRRFGLDQSHYVLGTTLFLSLTTSLPTYNSLLLADALAGFGILSFIILATPGRLSRAEVVFLSVVLVYSAISHLTHVVMLVSMLAALAAFRTLTWVPRPPKRAWIAGIVGLVIGLASIQITSFATQAVFGKPPQLLPVITARFIADGPGLSFIESGCDDQRFQVCRIPIGMPENAQAFLFNTDRQTGGWMIATTEQRRRMGDEDISFALAVLKHKPVEQMGMLAANTLNQLVEFQYRGLNQSCVERPDCWVSLPPNVRADLFESLSGRGLWPYQLMNAILYLVVIVSCIMLALFVPKLNKDRSEEAKVLLGWLLIGGTAMLVNAFLGGAVSESQYRYQGRLIWLVPLLAIVAALLKFKANDRRGLLDGASAQGGTSASFSGTGPQSQGNCADTKIYRNPETC